MRRISGFGAGLVILMCTARLVGEQRRGVQVWFVDSLVKVFPYDPPGEHRLFTPEFWGARNQHVSIQLVLRSPVSVAQVTAEVEPLTSAEGTTISGAEVRAVGYVVVASHSPDTPSDELLGEAPGWYPDPLLNLPVDIPANRAYALWVTVHVPPDAAPGLYHGAVIVRAGVRRLARAGFRLRVVGAAVPEERNLKVTNWFTLDDKQSRQFYGIPALTEEWWQLVENVARVLAEHRQNVVITPVLELVQPYAKGNELRYNFANFDRWVEAFKRAGVIEYIEGGHLVGRGGSSYDGPPEVSTFQLVDGQVRQQTLPVDDSRVESFLSGFLSALNAHLEQKGWKPYYLQHILDEAHGPEPPHYARIAQLVRRYLPGVLTIDAVDAAEIPEELKANCDLWVPQLGRFDDQMELLRKRIESGREVWFYTCLVPRGRYMNRLMDYPLLKVRLLHWLNFRCGLTGFLHWGGNYWTPEPMLATQPIINANQTLLPSGDAFIVYPDPANRSVLSSIRFEAMRAGIEDYELLRALRARNPAEAERIAKAAVADFTNYVRDVGVFRQLERRLLEALAE